MKAIMYGFFLCGLLCISGCGPTPSSNIGSKVETTVASSSSTEKKAKKSCCQCKVCTCIDCDCCSIK